MKTGPLPSDLTDALARVIADQRRQWRREMDTMAAESRATIADLRTEIVSLKAEGERLVRDCEARVAAAVASVKDGAPGKDGCDAEVDWELIDKSVLDRVQEHVAALPPAEKGEPGEPGKDGAPGRDAEPVTEMHVLAAFSENDEVVRNAVAQFLTDNPVPAGKDGRDGVDGKDADPDLMAAMIAETVAALPPAERGEPGPQGERGEKGEPGEPVPAEVVERTVAEHVERAVATIPPPERGEKGEPGERGPEGPAGVNGKDGLGQAGALINRSGELVVTMTDGTAHVVGEVVGKDGAPGKDGRDGFGVDDLDVVFDGERTITLRWAKGEHVEDRSFVLPIMLDRGVYKAEREKPYQTGDVVSYGGSIWTAQKETRAKPDSGTGDWRLSVKKGRDGKDGKDGERGPQGPQGEPFVSPTRK